MILKHVKRGIFQKEKKNLHTNVIFIIGNNIGLYIYTENPEWIIWLIWAIVCHYTDKKTYFSHIFESFCPCTDPLHC